MRYISTRGGAAPVGFDEALLDGLAPDGGLYVPETWPTVTVTGHDYATVATSMIAPFVEGSVAEAGLQSLVADAYATFRHPDVAPLTEVGGRHLLELFWGPTFSFKDYALQVVGRMFDVVLRERGARITVLGATSGDTGSAAIEAMRGLDNVDVVILYPQGRVSDIQRRQMTTVDAPNVRAVAVEGTFDDCQDLVKAAFNDPALRQRFGLAAVNSINWARVMVQTAYYAWVGTRLDGPFRVAVPTGNFGNVLAARVARRVGVPIDRLIVANNANHGLASLLTSGRLTIDDVVATVAPAMDIQVPSNLERYLHELVDEDGQAVARLLSEQRQHGALVLPESVMTEVHRLFDGYWFGDDDVLSTIHDVYVNHGVALDPHTAIGWRAADLAGDGAPIVSVATAHPAKFADAVLAATGHEVELPPELAGLIDRPETIIECAGELRSVAAVLEGLDRRE